MIKRMMMVACAALLLAGAISLSHAQDAQREFTLKMNAADLQVLDAAINKAPLPRELTQPFVAKMQAQIVEQSKPKDEPKPADKPNGTSTPPK